MTSAGTRVSRPARAVVGALGACLACALPASAAPTSATIAGSLQSELGCPGDWMPDCPLTGLTENTNDGVWRGTFDLPAGAFEYKLALDGSWNENYGLHGEPNGANLPLTLLEPRTVRFYYHPETHWVTDDVHGLIASLAGTFQSELGCPSDWHPGCLRSWLQDVDGDGVYEFETTALPAGAYASRIAIREGWDEHYGEGGTREGADLAFSVPFDGAAMHFRFDGETKLLTVQAPEPSAALAALFAAGGLAGLRHRIGSSSRST